MTRRSLRLMPILLCLLWFALAAISLRLDHEPAHAAEVPLFERMVRAEVEARGAALFLAVDSAAETGTLFAGDPVLLVGRTQDATWLHALTYLGEGYLRADALNIEGDLARLPLRSGSSTELTVAMLPEARPPADPSVAPIRPVIPAYMTAIYARGLALGNEPGVFSKVGDCLTDDVNLFFGGFGRGDYDLGTHSELQRVIDYYAIMSPREGVANSFVMPSLAARSGYNSSSVHSPLWSNPDVCQENETPLECEYRLARPAVAIILFGTNDVQYVTARQFDFFLRLTVHDTLTRGIIPLLSTFPGDPYRVQESHLYNQIILKIARDFEVPVINLWLALQALPGQGRNPNSMYLSWVEGLRTSHLTPENLEFGHTMHNLVTLQALNAVLESVILLQ